LRGCDADYRVGVHLRREKKLQDKSRSVCGELFGAELGEVLPKDRHFHSYVRDESADSFKQPAERRQQKEITMKRIKSLSAWLISAALLLNLAACSSNESAPNAPAAAPESSAAPESAPVSDASEPTSDNPDNPETSETREPPLVPPMPAGNVRVITNFSAEDVSAIRIVNRLTGDDGYQIRATGGGEFHILEINQRTSVEHRANIPYNQESFTELAGLVAQLSTARLVEEDAEDLVQYGLTNETQNARVGLTFSDHTRVAFMLGNPTPDGVELYFRLSDSNDIYTVRLSDVSPLLADEYHWVQPRPF
jgi:hypothetical protein